MTRNCQVFKCLRSRQSAIGQLIIIGHFRVIDFEILREFHFRRTDKLHVSCTAQCQFDGHGIVGLYVSRIDRRCQFELTHCSRESGRFGRKRLHVNHYFRSRDFLLHFHVSSAIEESIKRVVRNGLLGNHPIKCNRRDFQFTRLLWEQHILAPYSRIVVPSFIMFQRKSLLLRQFYLLCMETLQIGHLAIQLTQIHHGIYLISQQNGFLLVYGGLAGCSRDKQIIGRDTATCCLTA